MKQLTRLNISSRLSQSSGVSVMYLRERIGCLTSRPINLISNSSFKNFKIYCFGFVLCLSHDNEYWSTISDLFWVFLAVYGKQYFDKDMWGFFYLPYSCGSGGSKYPVTNSLFGNETRLRKVSEIQNIGNVIIINVLRIAFEGRS